MFSAASGGGQIFIVDTGQGDNTDTDEMIFIVVVQ